MSLTNKKYSYDQLASVNKGGLDIALYPQIRDAIAERMKEIYGDDIDLSTASADGQYINMEALILNNIYRLVDSLYGNLNPSTAQGKYLDILCGLSNVTRRSATKSTAVVRVTNVSDSSGVALESLLAQDKNGNEWEWRNSVSYMQSTLTVQLGIGESIDLPFTCQQSGPIEAYALNNDISICLNANYQLEQIEDAIPGTDEEGDTALRLRRSRYLSENSVTVQQGLETALYNLNGVEDVFVFNNSTGADKTFSDYDGKVVKNHDVYICAKYNDNLNSDTIDQLIANTVYGKMTPGVCTSGDESETVKGGVLKYADINIAQGYNVRINWKKCSVANPYSIVIRFTYTPEFDRSIGDGPHSSDFSGGELSIIEALKNYLNNLSIDTKITVANVQSVFMQGDLRPNGNTTIFTLSGAFKETSESDNSNYYQLPLAYLKYNDSNFAFTYITGLNQGILNITA